MIIPNGFNNYIYIGIVSNMLELSAKGIFSINQVRPVGHLYDKKPSKLGVKLWLVTTDGRESCMFIVDRLAYLPIIFPTGEEIESYSKVPITPAGEWKPSDIDEKFQWDDSDDDASFGCQVPVY